MNQNMIIQNEDFDTYYFDIPKSLSVNALSRKNLERYIFAELERVHPFFGPHCKVDFRIVLQAQKLKVCAVVIDSITLEKYQNETEGKSLYVNISSNTKMQPQKVFRKTLKLSKKYIAIIVFIFVMGLVSQMYLSFESNEKKEFVALNKEPSHNATEGSVLTNLFFLKFSDWVKSGITCTSISYSKSNKNQKNDDYKIEIATAFEGLNAEQMYSPIMQQDFHNERYSLSDAITVNPVVYIEGISYTSLFFSELYKESTLNFPVQNAVVEYNFIRELVINHNGYMQQENWKTQEYVFSVPVLQWEMFYTQLYEHLRVKFNTLQSFSFSINGDSSLIAATIRIVEGAIPEYFSFLNDAFQAQVKLHLKSTLIVAEATNKEEERLHFKEDLKKIGNIKKADGSWLTFYENQEGKIIARED